MKTTGGLSCHRKNRCHAGKTVNLQENELSTQSKMRKRKCRKKKANAKGNCLGTVGNLGPGRKEVRGRLGPEKGFQPPIAENLKTRRKKKSGEPEGIPV